MAAIAAAVLSLACTAAVSALWSAAGARPAPADPRGGKVTLAFTGDTLLRHQPLVRDRSLAQVSEAIRQADLAFANLESALLDPRREAAPSQTPVALPPPHGQTRDASVLADLGFDAVSLANNHALDFGLAGLLTTREGLTAAGLATAGAGVDLAAARDAARLGADGTIAFVAATVSLSDRARATAARGDIAGRPGAQGLRYSAEVTLASDAFDALRQGLTAMGTGHSSDDAIIVSGTRIVRGDRRNVRVWLDEEDRAALLGAVGDARAHSSLVVVSLHCHEPANGSETPPDFVQVLARELVDAGATVVFGHGPHRLRGIERHGDGVIFYSLGDFLVQRTGLTQVDEYESQDNLLLAAVGGESDAQDRPPTTPVWSRDSLVAVATFERERLVEVRLLPLALREDGRPSLASDTDSTGLLDRLNALSAPFRTRIRTAAGRWLVERDLGSPSSTSSDPQGALR